MIYLNENMKIESLQWDSLFFGYKVGKIHLKGKLDLELLKNDSEFDLIYIFSQKPLSEMNCLDRKVLLEKSITLNDDISEPDVKIWKKGINSDLVDLAILSGHSSRFKKDKRLNDKFEDLYTLWIENSINGDIADYVVVTSEGNKITGMLTLSIMEEYSMIGLIAVDKTRQGSGVGVKLMNKAFQLTKRNNLNSIRVETQEENSIAMSFYKRNEFLVKKVSYIYHYWTK